MDGYQQLLERIANAAKIPSSEVERKVEAKRAKLSGLVSKEGAAQIVAAELGINFDNEAVKLNQILPSMKRAHVVVQVVQVFPVRSYSKNGREGKVANLSVADETGSLKLVLWDTNHISLVENGSIKVGDVLEVSQAGVRNGELHLSSFGDIKHSNQKLNGVSTEKQFTATSLTDARAGQRIKTRAFVLQAFEPRYFTVCPECSKKMVDGQCNVHGTQEPEKRALLNVLLDDGSEALRAVLFGEQIKLLGLDDNDIFSLEAFALKKDSFLGEEYVFTGNLRTNALYNTTELIIEAVEAVNPEKLIAELQKQ